MNKIFNKLFLGLAVCGLAMTACSDGVEWEPSPVPTEGVQAYIYADNTDLTYYPNDEQVFVVKIGRQKTDAAASIHLTTVLPIYHRQVLPSPASGKTTRFLYAPYLLLQSIAYHNPSCHNQ